MGLSGAIGAGKSPILSSNFTETRLYSRFSHKEGRFFLPLTNGGKKSTLAYML